VFVLHNACFIRMTPAERSELLDRKVAEYEAGGDGPAS
jgi:hypothetical protein